MLFTSFKKMTIMKKIITAYLLSTLSFCLSAADCTCGPGWDIHTCSILFDACDEHPLQPSTGVISSAPADVRAGYYVEDEHPGLRVVFKAPAENAAVVRMFDVTIMALDYPVGVNECFRVKLDRSVRLTANDTFDLRCLNSEDLLPRQKFGITVQPSPTDESYSNGKKFDYWLPGCVTFGKKIRACSNNYEDPYQWTPHYKPQVVVPDGCNGAAVTVIFDTYPWPNGYSVSTYKISVCYREGNREVCPGEYSRLVDCQEELRSGHYACNTTYSGLYPRAYKLYQQIHQDNGDGYVVIGDYRIEAAREFSICDPGEPQIGGMPQNIIQHVMAGVDNVTVKWHPPTVTNYVTSMVTLTSNYEPGDSFPIGETEVIYMAVDNLGRNATSHFKITVIGPTPSPPPTQSPPPTLPPLSGHSKNQDNALDSKKKLIIGGVSGGTLALLLLVCVMVLRWKELFPKTSSDDGSSTNSDNSQRRTPTEDTDITGTYRGTDTDILVNYPEVIAGNPTIPNECVNSNYVCYDDNELKNVMDDVSLTGQIIPSPTNSYPSTQPTLRLHITTGPATTQPGQWVSACVENEPQVISIDSEKYGGKYGYGRIDSHDSGIGGIENLQYPSTDITSISQISGAEEA